jgi:hypothetical protein
MAGLTGLMAQVSVQERPDQPFDCPSQSRVASFAMHIPKKKSDWSWALQSARASIGKNDHAAEVSEGTHIHTLHKTNTHITAS